MTELSELFADVAPDIQKSIRDLGWDTPTPVQAAAIPRMRAGGDLIVQAQTGSGKTGAFGIPLVEAIDTNLAETQAIVLLPTRELANQVAVELDLLGKYRGVRTLPIYGGVAYGPQLEGLERGAHIVVGTPGRILDHLKNNRMDLSHTKVLVLDEADEMLSLGFWPDMKEIASFLPKKRQSHLFSATMPEKVRSLSRFFLTDAEDVTIVTEGGSPQKIEHYYYLAPAAEKEALLARILEYENPESAIIFCNTKADVRFITAYLAKRGFNIDQISGDLAQAAREKAIAKIKAGKLRFLVATDVAARGIDISDLAYVINYTTSDSPEIYVHRTGRTGRAGKSGVAISLVSGLDIGNFKYMQVVSGIKITEKKAPTERDLLRRRKKRELEQAEAQSQSPSAPSAESAAEPAVEIEAPAETTIQAEEVAEAPAARTRNRRSAAKTAPADDPTLETTRTSDTNGDDIETLKSTTQQALDQIESDAVTEKIAGLLPFVRKSAETEEGLRELTGICVAYLATLAAQPSDGSGVGVARKDTADRQRPESDDSSSETAAARRRRARRGSSARSSTRTTSVDDSDATRAERPPRSASGESRGSDDRPPRRRRRSGGGSGGSSRR